ncbi:hypothetical protein ACFXPX_36735 [Kitasatospora sp. NPDC059146]|uniref:hypothetical protein n=1 Tax=unclassified Kitasatospora TaxID=2633591 RepID=UPI00367397E6
MQPLVVPGAEHVTGPTLAAHSAAVPANPAAGERPAPAGGGAQPRTEAVIRRVGPPNAFTSSVEFPDHKGARGILRYVSHYPLGSYKVLDDRGRPVAPDRVEGGAEAVTALARHYGLPLPVRIIPRGPVGSRPPAGSASGWR